jgi:hypothetical protein
MNKLEREIRPGVEAEVQYLDGEYRIVRHGTFVTCAVTGVAIPLDDLRYWSVDRQEAYATPDAVMARLKALGRTVG